MDKYWIVWRYHISPKDMYLAHCTTKSDAIKIASHMEGIEYTHARSVGILNLELPKGFPTPDLYLAYKKKHLYEKNYSDIIIYYGTEKAVVDSYADIYNIETKDVGIQKMDIFDIRCMSDTKSDLSENI